jgi:hypothetical protein
VTCKLPDGSDWTRRRADELVGALARLLAAKRDAMVMYHAPPPGPTEPIWREFAAAALAGSDVVSAYMAAQMGDKMLEEWRERYAPGQTKGEPRKGDGDE